MNWRLAVAGHLRWLVVAGPADLPRHRAVALDRVGVAVLAGHAAVEVVGVVEHAGGQADLLLGRIVAGLAAADRLLVAPVLQALEVAQEAGVQRHDEVLALHDLRVAGDAAELLAAALLVQVRRVVEADGDRRRRAGCVTVQLTLPSSSRFSWQPLRRQETSWISACGLEP